MRNYAVLSTLTDEGRRTVRKHPERIQQVNKSLESMGVKVVAQYILLGQYDFLTIIQAKDNKTVLKGSLELGSRGTMQTMTLPAIPIDEFIADIKG